MCQDMIGIFRSEAYCLIRVRSACFNDITLGNILMKIKTVGVNIKTLNENIHLTRAFVVTSNQNHRINILFNII